MGVGEKIKEYRNKNGLTQKDLADKLHVTYQAVSRWENEDVEPSFDTLKEMCKILNCSMDDLFNIEPKDKEEPKVVEKVVVQETKPILAACEKCNRPIYESDEIHRFTIKTSDGALRNAHVVETKYLYCEECYEEKLKEDARIKRENNLKEADNNRKRRIHSFIWPTILAIIVLIIGINTLTKGNSSIGVLLIVCSFLSYTFLACLILDNTFVSELWWDIASWTGVRFPGLIFSFSLDGFMWLIGMKILFLIISIGLAIGAVLLATALALPLSIFAYPFDLGINIKEEKKLRNSH